MNSLEEYFAVAIEFHGHRCPAMPVGLRAGLAARQALGVERSLDKELAVLAETGRGHAMGCFLDGVMTATGCTCGKGNIEKKYYDKMAFTLIDRQSRRAVRVSLKPEFVEMALGSPFVQLRRAGVPPQEIAAEVVDPQVDKVLSMPEEAFLEIGSITEVAPVAARPMFETRRCDRCGESVFVEKLRILTDGSEVCIPCSGYGD